MFRVIGHPDSDETPEIESAPNSEPIRLHCFDRRPENHPDVTLNPFSAFMPIPPKQRIRRGVRRASHGRPVRSRGSSRRGTQKRTASRAGPSRDDPDLDEPPPGGIQTALPFSVPLDPRVLAGFALSPRERGQIWNELDLCPLQRGCIEEGMRLVAAGAYPQVRTPTPTKRPVKGVP